MKKQVIGMLGVTLIASIAFLPVSNAMWRWRGKPFQEIWEAIHELQSNVENLNAALAELQSRVDVDKITTIHVVVRWKNASVYEMLFNGLSISDVYNHTGGLIYKNGILGPGEHTWLKVFIPGEIVRMDIDLDTQWAEPPWYGNVTMYREDGTLIGEYVTAYPNASNTFFIDASDFF